MTLRKTLKNTDQLFSEQKQLNGNWDGFGQKLHDFLPVEHRTNWKENQRWSLGRFNDGGKLKTELFSLFNLFWVAALTHWIILKNVNLKEKSLFNIIRFEIMN